MREFAHLVGWRIHKPDADSVDVFCPRSASPRRVPQGVDAQQQAPRQGPALAPILPGPGQPPRRRKQHRPPQPTTPPPHRRRTTSTITTTRRRRSSRSSSMICMSEYRVVAE
ncbi:Zinc-finger homeodomain protein 7 [Zea mays]|uniref:Zinc-finger homeodomain protein 7 n=1 Tax=Zea mays TaxID=4577 RepID=A0A3L6D6C4_MAIZE|nr:Zinc-finger homeodomain protein 7 [Zea mays]